MSIKASWRLITSALEVSPVGRIKATRRPLRIYLKDYSATAATFTETCAIATQHCLMQYSGEQMTLQLLAQRFSAWHTSGGNSGNRAGNGSISLPRWAETSGEDTVLDVYRYSEFDQCLAQCNSLILVHDTEEHDALDDLKHLVLSALPAAVAANVPVILAGAIGADTLQQQSGSFAAHSLYGRWHHRYAKIALTHPGSVYSVHFFCPQDPRTSFDLLYRAQMAALYPLSRCFVSVDGKGFHPTPELVAATKTIFVACDLEDDSVWCAADWRGFWMEVYHRDPSEKEARELQECGLYGASEPRLLQWFFELTANGKGDSLWAVLRAFGYQGDLRLSELRD